MNNYVMDHDGRIHHKSSKRSQTTCKMQTVNRMLKKLSFVVLNILNDSVVCSEFQIIPHPVVRIQFSIKHTVKGICTILIVARLITVSS